MFLPLHLRAGRLFAFLVLGATLPLAASAQNVPVATQMAAAPAPATPSAPGKTPAAPATTAVRSPILINGRLYVKPTPREQFHNYVHNTYGWPGIAGTSFRALYGQARGKPDEWGQDWPGFGQRFGTATATTVINGNVRYGMEMAFHEDMRYLPCHGCSVKRKIGNALLAEITARHASDGHRFFTLTPTIADFAGPVIASSFWIPNHGPADGIIGSRLVFATRIGGHLFTEFVMERRHKDRRIDDSEPLRRPNAPAPAVSSPGAGTQP